MNIWTPRDDLVRAAKAQAPRRQWSHGNAQTVLEAALRHVYERNSVVREGEVPRAALELHPEFHRWRELRQALEPILTRSATKAK